MAGHRKLKENSRNMWQRLGRYGNIAAGYLPKQIQFCAVPATAVYPKQQRALILSRFV